MADQMKNAPLETVEWQVNSFRLTAFPSPDATVDAEKVNWWSDVVGDTPESKVLQPRVGGSHESGTLEGGKLVLEIQPARVDWLFTASEESILSSGAIPTIGLFDKTLGTFLTIIEKWLNLEDIPSLSRLAFGSILLYPVTDKKSGYITLQRYLPKIEIDPEGSSDFFYQINRPRDSKSKGPNLKINRLSKWGLLEYTVTMMTAPGSFVKSPSRGNFACRLELDINSSAAFIDKINRESIQGVLLELIELGKEIVEKGDVP